MLGVLANLLAEGAAEKSAEGLGSKAVGLSYVANLSDLKKQVVGQSVMPREAI